MLPMSEKKKFHPFDFLLLGLSIYVIVVLIAEVTLPLSKESRQILAYADFAVCLIFLTEFFVRLSAAESKREYLKWGWIDLISSIPTVGELRWGRAARLLRLIRVLRLMQRANFLKEYFTKRRPESVLSIVVLSALLLQVVASLAILHFERDPESNIKSGGEALWWSLVTMTTVGYGDFYPVTLGGRVIAAVLMVVGVSLFATLSGFLASSFLKPPEDELENEVKQLRRDIQDLRELLLSRNP